MAEKEEYLDYVLVPTGLLIMVCYHIWLLYRVVYHPSTTVIGINAINRRFWVRAMMEVYVLQSRPQHSFLLFKLSLLL